MAQPFARGRGVRASRGAAPRRYPRFFLYPEVGVMQNLFLVLTEALAWTAAHDDATLTMGRLTGGDLQVQAQVSAAPGPTLTLSEVMLWTVSAIDLQKSFACDPAVSETPVEVPLVDRIGAEMRAYIGKPMGPQALCKALQDADHPVTVAVKAKALALQARLDAGESIDPFPARPAREPLLPKGFSPFSLPRG